MRILMVGSGGREHALAWALARSDRVDSLISAPGSPGMAALGRTFDLAVDDLAGLARLAAAEKIDLTVAGPEAPLVAGIADVFAEDGLKVFGPTKAAAEIEGSKVFCREVARRAGVPMAQGESFDDPEAALDYALTLGPPVVVKAEGLAAGKGVLICETHGDVRDALGRIMRERAFGDAGSRVVIEEFLEGRETSIFALSDGERIVILEPAHDYKRALDGDGGLNTGGMGAYSPVAWLDADARSAAVSEVVEPMIRGLSEMGRTYVGCFYAGLMMTDKGPRLIEVNCRFGDPETQALVRRMDFDLAEAFVACTEGRLRDIEPAWTSDAAVCVVGASGGYPESYETGVPIRGIEGAEQLDGVVVFHAGTADDRGELLSAGGRVLCVTATGPTMADARTRAYEGLDVIEMDGMHARRDIAEGVA